MYRFLTLLLLLSWELTVFAGGPYAPPAGQSGTTALYMDSSAFLAWAHQCTVTRGPMNASDTSQGYASAGDSSFAIGEADQNGVVSLGDGGKAVLSFEGYIHNGPGPDFAVFENSFSHDFLELAFVEVSSNGQDFYRFPATSLTDTSQQVGSFDTLDATNLQNLAGKYKGGYGTPFDLDDLSGVSGLNVDSITHIRVVDVVGNIDAPYATYDEQGKAVNDPWPTAFSSGGFDLDAVGAIHFTSVVGIEPEKEAPEVKVYPIPARERLYVESSGENREITITDLKGRTIHEREWKVGMTSLDVRGWPSGLYFLKVGEGRRSEVRRFLIE